MNMVEALLSPAQPIPSSPDETKGPAPFSQAFPSPWHAHPIQCALQANTLLHPARSLLWAAFQQPFEQRCQILLWSTPHPVTALISLSFSEVYRHLLCSWAVSSSSEVGSWVQGSPLRIKFAFTSSLVSCFALSNLWDLVSSDPSSLSEE